MIPFLKSSRIHLVLTTGICSLLLAGAAVSQQTPPAIVKEGEAQPEKARVLLDQVKKSEQDRLIAAKQTEIDRLKEDQARIEGDSNGLEKTIESTAGLSTDATDHLAALTMESRRLEHELAVAEARINAEKLKIEGLRALNEAQAKSLSALARRAEETEARSRLHTIELEQLQAGKRVPAEGRELESHAELVKARKALAAAEAKTESEERIAHEAMKVAAAKMTQAETSATRAQRLADNDLTLQAEMAKAAPKAKAIEKVTPAKPAPVAAGPKPAAGTPDSAKPAATATTTKRVPAPTATPARR